ncbi:MAG: phosphate/phosphite/phosphonate ABC transporter substrate-binding protein [Gammaproteobacteria bacterium]|nr:phosphate/phosphite/phosphonate ABC transporter substrate-binding protein [Gammaproteobacteria bacterium]
MYRVRPNLQWLVALSFCLLLIGSSLVAAAEEATVGSEPVSEPLRIGIFPRRNSVLTMKLFRPLSRYIEEQLGEKVELETSADFKSFWKLMGERRYDLVHLNQYHYIMAHNAFAYDVLVQNEEFGEKTIRGAIYVRKDSGFTGVEQLRDRDILFGGGKLAMMSYIVPTYLLRQGGLEAGAYREHFSTSPPNTVLATYLGQVDAGGAGDIVLRLPMVTNKIDVSELQLLAVSEELAHLPWAVKAEMDSRLKERLRQLLLTMATTEAGAQVLQAARLSGFNPVSDEDYAPHAEIARVAGISSK